MLYMPTHSDYLDNARSMKVPLLSAVARFAANLEGIRDPYQRENAMSRFIEQRAEAPDFNFN